MNCGVQKLFRLLVFQDFEIKAPFATLLFQNCVKSQKFVTRVLIGIERPTPSFVTRNSRRMSLSGYFKILAHVIQTYCQNCGKKSHIQRYKQQ